MNEDILEGLKNALSKGESLKYAMQSFYNAGYDVKEIQEAARALKLGIPKQSPLSNSKTFQDKSKFMQTEKTFSKNSVQKVSNYEQQQSNPRKIVVTIIVILLVILIIGLGVIFLFRENILEFIEALVN